MKIVIQSVQGNKVVEFPEDVFRKLLVSYTEKYNGDAAKALDQIEYELKQLTITA